MFFKKSKATKVALGATEPIINSLKATPHGIPNGFWDDPYVLGFLCTTIQMFASFSVNGKLSVDDSGIITMNVLESLSGISGTEIGNKAVGYLEGSNADFRLGGENAAKCVLVAYDMAGEELLSDPDVLRAQTMANDPNLRSIEPGSTAGALQYLLFYQVIKERLIEPI